MKRLKNIRKKLILYIRRHVYKSENRTIQMTISLTFTVIAISMIFALFLTLYQLFVHRDQNTRITSAEQMLDQTALNLEDYLRNMRRISDAIYYSAIKDKDMSENSVTEDMDLLYEANIDSLLSIATFTKDGELLNAVPNSTAKDYLDIQKQEWFSLALKEVENLHFSRPHIENLFDDPAYRYKWTISLSRAIEITRNKTPEVGVLLVDMNYSGVEEILAKANMGNTGEYIYLIDGNGNIIYHPRQRLISSGIAEENNAEAATYFDGVHEEKFNGEKRVVVSKSISYTGWKLVNVIPDSSFRLGIRGIQLYAILTVSVGIAAIILLNLFLSYVIARPIKRLNDSVKEWESGNMNPKIYVGGTIEVEHLGRTLSRTVRQIRQLMDRIVIEQEEKRKSELDALQSQINPHFLYNTLESIIWMIEGERYKEAVYMVSELSSLFRISLSKGKTIISIEDEVKHARNYMNIQKIRYKNSFTVDFDIQEEILKCCTVKLIIQPLLENAIYYGVEGMDGEGEIYVKGYRKEDDIYIDVIDNGIGIPQESAQLLLTEDNHVHKHGSGVGIINVHNRIKLRFGEQYGLEIESEPDEGSTFRIHLPYIPFDAENQEFYEKGGRHR
ncbi:two-component system, sensor histidine kinase YesM [Lachnospiraceae bacterium KH1T2]|nr:two-component system, sensor histidine kinase YesM [Lachnospiraceae bacterium KH1T2]